MLKKCDLESNDYKVKAVSFILLLFSVGYAQASEVPKINQKEIIFAHNKRLRYENSKVLYSNPLEAQKHNEPVSISEKPSLIKPWGRVVLVRTENFFEGSQKEVRVYDYEGNLLNPAARIEGEVSILEGPHRIFLGGESAHSFVDKSYLLNDDGKLIREIPQPRDVFKFGFSKNGKIIWILSTHVKKGVPIGQIDVIDSDDNKIKTFEFSKAQTIEVTHGGKSYKIPVPAPEMPG